MQLIVNLNQMPRKSPRVANNPVADYTKRNYAKGAEEEEEEEQDEDEDEDVEQHSGEELDSSDEEALAPAAKPRGRPKAAEPKAAKAPSKAAPSPNRQKHRLRGIKQCSTPTCVRRRVGFTPRVWQKY